MRHARAVLVLVALAACAPRFVRDPSLRPALDRAAATITPAHIHDRVAVLASDAFRGRDTPSPGLDSAAAWIAREFAAFGLQPAGTDGWLQRYAYPLQALDVARARFHISAGGTRSLEFGADYYALPAAGPEVRAGAVFVRTAGGLAGAREDGVRGRVALVPLDGAPEPGRRGFRFPRDTRQAIAAAVDEAGAAGAAAVVFLLDERVTGGEVGALAEAAARAARVYGAPDEEGNAAANAPPPTFFLARTAALRLFSAAGLDGGALLASGAGRAVPLPGVTLTLSAPVRRLDRAEAPNVVALLPGSDPALRDTYVLVTAHMDHLGVGSPVAGDSIYNGADDDASGTAAVLEIAQAFASLPVPPKRSVLFLTVSGEEKGLLGSRWFADHPTVAMERIVADLNLDMIARNAPDSIVVIGQDYSSLGELARAVARDHPALGLTLADDLWPEQRFFFRSDHFSFAAKEVPALFFFAGTHDDYHRPGDEVETIDADKNARVARLVFLLADRIANDPEPPRWTSDGLAEVRRMTRAR